MKYMPSDASVVVRIPTAQHGFMVAWHCSSLSPPVAHPHIRHCAKPVSSKCTAHYTCPCVLRTVLVLERGSSYNEVCTWADRKLVSLTAVLLLHKPLVLVLAMHTSVMCLMAIIQQFVAAECVAWKRLFVENDAVVCFESAKHTCIDMWTVMLNTEFTTASNLHRTCLHSSRSYAYKCGPIAE
jgi:hypothetical protein